ncbi:MAG: winged helix-turn-helix domain-containing protein [Spirochaetaceae bacterium]|nr:winged helix-turn-helix domain-containing protein [Myxococcales bacterium]MCB9722474.1 winged helix-turn-helix domain-containing protein [Spirochaetaceae bacterium]HPG28650.1 winged helix-turn-helix transcriptional regulator [Myxococcota bacterium]
MATRSTTPGRKSGARAAASSRSPGDHEPTWTFLSNHSHVLLCLHRDPELTLREVAERVGITERSVQRILGELEEAGYVHRERVGLRNRYRFRTTAALRHPIEAHCRIGDLIRMVEERLD